VIVPNNFKNELKKAQKSLKIIIFAHMGLKNKI
jgi:uncharacterized radical SAM superfamily protein